MAKRGRKSAAELATITPTPEKQARPDACYSLPDEAAYSRTGVQLRRLGQLIHQAESGPDPLDLPTYLTKIKAHVAAAQTLKTLATSLRLTPQSRYRAESAARAIDGKRHGQRPWEF